MKKKENKPREENVAAIFLQIYPDFPTPQKIRLPLLATKRSKRADSFSVVSLSSKSATLSKALDSESNTSFINSFFFIRCFQAKIIVVKSKALVLILALIISNCSSYKQFHYYSQDYETPTKVFSATFLQTWQATLQVVKKYNLYKKSKANGVIQTAWIDNTKEINFSENFGQWDSVRAAQFKLTINVIKGFRGSKEATKVTISKRQQIERGFLQGWKNLPADGILEKSILYRIGRILAIEKHLESIENQKFKEEKSSDPESLEP